MKKNNVFLTKQLADISIYFYTASIILGAAVLLWPHKIAGVYVSLYRLAVPLFFLYALWKWLKNRNEVGLFRFGKYFAALAILPFIATILFFFSPFVAKVEGLKQVLFCWEYLVIPFTLLQLVDSEERVETFEKAVHLIYIVVTFIAIIEIVTGLHLPTSRSVGDVPLSLQTLFRPSDWETGKFSSLSSVFYNTNDFSAFLVTYLPFLFFRELDKSHFILKLIKLIPLFFILAYNDANICLMAMLMSFVFACFTGKEERRAALIGMAVFILTDLVLCNLILSAFKQLIPLILKTDLQPMDKILDFGKKASDQINHAIEGRGSLHSRFHINLETFLSSMKNYFIGFGPGSFTTYFTRYPSETKLLDPHNYWLEILFIFGLPGLLSYLYVYISGWFRLWKQQKMSFRLSGPTKRLALAFVALAVASIAPSSFVNYGYFKLLHGLCFAELALGQRVETNHGTISA